MPTIVESPETAELLAELTMPTGREDPYPRYDRPSTRLCGCSSRACSP